MTIREADPDRDFDRIAEIRNQSELKQLSAEALLLMDQDRTAGDFLLRLVGETSQGIVATAQIGRSLWDTDGLLFAKVWVDSEQQNQGHGSQFLNHIEGIARAENGSSLKTWIADHDPRARQFLERRSYEFRSHVFESILDLQAFDPNAHSAKPLNDVRFFTFAETKMDDEVRQKLWTLNVESCRGEPNADPNYTPTFESYSANVIGARWFDPTGQHLAAIGDEWVGICAIGEVAPGDPMNFFTGVMPAFRGQGLALALKLIGIRKAKERGCRTIRTGNDSRNAPMLAINRKLGYAPQPGRFEFRKPLC